MYVPVGGCLKQDMVFRRQRKREIVMVGPGSRFTPQHWLLCHMGLYQFEFEFKTV